MERKGLGLGYYRPNEMKRNEMDHLNLKVKYHLFADFED